MQLVVDANVLFSALIKEDKTAETLLSGKLSLITSEFIFSEIAEHAGEIALKTHRTPEEFRKFLSVLEWRVEIIPSAELKAWLAEAERISPDIDDVEYFAAALKLSCPIWSNDRRLKRQPKVQVFSTSELLAMPKS